jgi:integrase
MNPKINKTLISRLRPRKKPYEVNDATMAGFLVRVQPTGHITYYCSFRTPQRRRNRVVVGRHPTTTPAQARAHAQRVLADVIRGEDPTKSKNLGRQLTLGAYLKQEYGPWVEQHRKDGAATTARIKACFAEFEGLRLGEINPLRVERWRTQRLRDGLHPVTVNRDVSALRSALSKALEWGFVPEHPLAAIKPMKMDRKAAVRFLSDTEEGRLLKALDEREETLRAGRESANAWRRKRGRPELPDLRGVPFADHLKPMVILSLHTGLRQGELFNLRWAHVDLDKTNLTVEGTVAKSGSTRHVPLNEEAVETLISWRAQQPKARGLVFPSDGGKPFDNVNKAWHAVLKAAGILDFRWHDMRHHFASRLVMAEVDLNTVRELLGHTDIKMTLRYAHLAPEHKAAAVKKLVRSAS